MGENDEPQPFTLTELEAIAADSGKSLVIAVLRRNAFYSRWLDDQRGAVQAADYGWLCAARAIDAGQ